MCQVWDIKISQAIICLTYKYCDLHYSETLIHTQLARIAFLYPLQIYTTPKPQIQSSVLSFWVYPTRMVARGAM